MSFNNTRTPRKPTEKPKYPVPMRPHNGNGRMEYYMEGELKKKFCKLFPIHSNRRLMLWFGLSCSTVQRFARSFGLEKDMTAIRRELASDVKKICEANGYYDSIRGRVPSPQCLEATRRLRAEGFHPILQIKKNDPRRYKKILKERSEARKDLFRRERLRDIYGLERKTKLRMACSFLSRNAYKQKYLMRKKRNYFDDPDHPMWICYDSQTRRSPRMEATAQRHGLRVVEGEG